MMWEIIVFSAARSGAACDRSDSRCLVLFLSSCLQMVERIMHSGVPTSSAVCSKKMKV